MRYLRIAIGCAVTCGAFTGVLIMLRGPIPLWVTTGSLQLMAMLAVVVLTPPRRVVPNPRWKPMFGVLFGVGALNLAAAILLARRLPPWALSGASFVFSSFIIVPFWFPGTPRDSAS